MKPTYRKILLDREIDEKLRKTIAPIKSWPDNNDIYDPHNDWNILRKKISRKELPPLKDIRKKSISLEKEFIDFFYKMIFSIGIPGLLGELKNEYPDLSLQDLQKGILRGLRQFRIEGEETLVSCLHRSLNAEVRNVSRKKSPLDKKRNAGDTYIDNDGKERSLLEQQTDSQDDHSKLVEQRELIFKIEKFFGLKRFKIPLDQALDAWSGKDTLLDEASESDHSLPIIRQHILRKLAMEQIPTEVFNQDHVLERIYFRSAQIDVFFRRKFWKKGEDEQLLDQ